MKTIFRIQNSFSWLKCRTILSISVVFVAIFISLASCQDKLDKEDMYTFTADLVSSYVAKEPELSDFDYLIHHVKLGGSQSTIDKLLSARGNYTCFIPTNDAIQQFIDSIYGVPDLDISQVSDSLAEVIVRNSLINNEDEDAYQTSSFYEGSLDRENMNNRYLTVSFDTIQGGKSAIYISTTSRIITPDIEVANGYIHIVNKVINPSASTLPDLIDSQDNLQIFSHLLKETGWNEQMKLYRNTAYEDKNLPHTMNWYGGTSYVPEHCNYGFTAFVEPDSLLEASFNIKLQKNNGVVTNWSEVMNKISEVCKEHYPNAQSSDLKSNQNAVNQFVSYHLLDAAIPYNKLVIHYNEVGFAYTRSEQLGIDKMQYFEVLGKPRRLLKITEGVQTQGKRINRYVKEYDENNFRELDVPIEGTLIQINNGNRPNSALNGYYFCIDEVLWYSDDVINKVLNERIRIDALSLLPELMTNGMRNVKYDRNFHIEDGYCKNLSFNSETKYTVLSTYGIEGDLSYEQGEPFVEGQFDIIYRLPPVPFSGTYELRMCYSTDVTRGMVQIYLGTNKDNLPAMGLPIEMRIRSNLDHNVRWVADTEDRETNRENDRIMKLHGYMKSPACFGYPSKVGTGATGRDGEGGIKLRKVLYTGSFNPEDVYYIRFKELLDNPSALFDLDFFELVPKCVYDGDKQEDIW